MRPRRQRSRWRGSVQFSRFKSRTRSTSAAGMPATTPAEGVHAGDSRERRRATIPASSITAGATSPIPLSNPRTLAAATRDLTWAGRNGARLAFVVCLATFILATVGLYAVVAHRAAQRRREFGLRVVLGARAPALVALVTGHVRAAMGIGLVVGVAGAVAWDRAFSPVPQKAFRVADPLVLAMALGVLVLVAGLGCALPIRRAIGVSPADLLRHE